MNIYISNLENNLTDQDLKELFQPFGEVASAKIQTDVFTGVSRGFGYVEMTEVADALKAIDKLNQSEVSGLIISVSPSVPKPEHKGSYKVGSGPMNIYRFKKN